MTDAEGGGSGRQTQTQKEWTLPDNEYRKWVRENISSGLTRLILGAGIAGLIGLYVSLMTFGSDILTSKIESQVKNDIQNRAKELSSGLDEKIANVVADFLINRVKLLDEAGKEITAFVPIAVKDYLNSSKAEAELLSAITNSKVVDETILRRSQQVASGEAAGSSFAQRAQALQLFVVFQQNQSVLRRTVSDILYKAAESPDADDQLLVNVALDSYPFSDGKSGADRERDAATMAAATKRLASETAGSSSLQNYRRFFSHLPSEHVPMLRAWLRMNGASPAAAIAANALFERPDGVGAIELLNLLAAEVPLPARVLAIQTIALGGKAAANLNRETRRAVFSAVWRVRADNGLASALPAEIAVGLRSANSISESEMSSNRFRVLDLVALPFLRTDGGGQDWSDFLQPRIYEQSTSSSSSAVLVRLWLKRIELDIGTRPSEREQLEQSAGAAFAALITERGWKRLAQSDVLPIVKRLLLNVPVARVQEFIRDYSQFYQQTPREGGATKQEDLLATAITRDAKSSPPYAATFSLIGKMTGMVADTAASSLVSALSKQPDLAGARRRPLPGEATSENIPKAERIDAADLLDSIVRLVDQKADRTKLALSALLLETAARLGDRRKVRAAVYRSGILTDAYLRKDVEPRLLDAAQRLAGDYPLPQCTKETKVFDLRLVSPGQPEELPVADATMMRVNLPQRSLVDARILGLAAEEQIDVFFWNEKCTRAIGYANEREASAELMSNGPVPILIATPPGKVPPERIQLRFEAAKNLRLVAGRQPYPLASGRTYEKPSKDDGDNKDRFYDLVAELQQGARLWLATSDLGDDVDTEIGIFLGDQEPGVEDDSIEYNDDIGDGNESALMFEPEKPGKYLVRLSSAVQERFRPTDGFSFMPLIFSGAPLVATSERQAAPVLQAEVYAEVDTGRKTEVRWIEFTAPSSGTYQLEYLVPPLRNPVLHDESGKALLPAGRDEDNQRTFTFDLVEGQQYFLDVAPSIADRAVLRMTAIVGTE